MTGIVLTDIPRGNGNHEMMRVIFVYTLMNFVSIGAPMGDEVKYHKYDRLLKSIQQKYDENFTTILHFTHNTTIISFRLQKFHRMDCTVV